MGERAMYDVAVLGAGIVGVSAAEWSRRLGSDVVLIDHQEPGSEASSGNAGILACCAVVPVAVPGILAKAPAMLLDSGQPLFLRWSYLPRLLPWLIPYLLNATESKVRTIAEALAFILGDSVDQHRALAAGTPAERWLNGGDYVYLYRDRSQFAADGFAWSIREHHGFKGDAMDRAALLDHDPNLGPRYAFGWKLSNHGHVSDPGRYVKDLAGWFTAQGGQVLRDSVADVTPAESGVTITLGGRQVRARNVVLALGAWSERLARRLGHRVRLESERGYHVDCFDPSHGAPCPYMVADGKFAVTPMNERLRFAGIVEFGGLEAPATTGPVALLKRNLKAIYPNLTYARETEQLCHRPATTDSLPLLGPSPKSPNIYFAFGHQHIGLTGGAKSGRIIAELIAGARSHADLSRFRVDRFG